MEKTPIKICFNTSRYEIKLEDFIAQIYSNLFEQFNKFKKK
ncbi:MAG: hypothetical protein RJA13_1757 [Bacteroidota bacterium]